MSLERELKLLGVEVSASKLDQIRKIAVDEYERKKVQDFLVTADKLDACFVMNIAHIKVIAEFMHGLQTSRHLKHKPKQEYKNLKRSCDRIVSNFEFLAKEDAALLNSYNIYVNDFSDAVYNHLDALTVMQEGLTKAS